MTIPELLKLAADHQRAGRADAAAEAWNHLGILYRQAGSTAESASESIAAFDRAITLKSDYADAYSNRGNTLRMLGRFDEAAQSYRIAFQINPNHAAAHANLANVLSDQGNFAQAIAEYGIALKLQPIYPLAQNNLANALRAVGRLDQAEAICRELLAANPKMLEVNLNLGNIYFDQQKFPEAIAAFQSAVKLQPQNPMLHNNLAMALGEADRPQEAIASAQEAVRLAPQYADGWNCLGNLLADEGLYDRAAEAFLRAIQLRPNFALAHWNYAAIPLLRGDFGTGFAEHEWRKLVDIPSAPRKFAQPEWHGEEIAGKTILVHAEQGFGDTIQFVRYAPLIAERGARVLLYGPPELASLFRESFSGVTVISSPLPEFDLHCPMLSLPHILKTRIENIPANVPYLKPPAEKVEMWRSRLKPTSARLRVGVAWAGNPKRKLNRRRSLDPKQLVPLTVIDSVDFYSLQKSAAPVAGMIDLTPDLADFSDTASLIQNLDLVITVDTAVAHLAGALAKPVWLLLGFVPAWRWMMDRSDSPWYPTMKLFRQPSMNNWDAPIAAAADMLRDLAAGK
jgi:tetratricopeptide (TPR) repeat protein